MRYKGVAALLVLAGGLEVRWVEDIGWAHLGGGEVHCTTNAWRAV